MTARIPSESAPSTPSSRNKANNGAPTRRFMTSDSTTAPSAVISSPFGKYFSRRRIYIRGSKDLPEVPHDEGHFRGIYSPVALLWGCVFLTVPLSYVYILLVLLRELCMTFPDTVYAPLEYYVPVFAQLVSTMKKSSLVVELWCVMEAVFYVCLKLHIAWLQSRDPLEASLSAAPMMELAQRRLLWQRMMDAVSDDPVTFLTGWFFDQPDLSSLSQYDIRDFIAWSMYESRHQEHLTTAELEQLEDFVQELEHRIALQLYGEEKDEMEKDEAAAEAAERDNDKTVRQEDPLSDSGRDVSPLDHENNRNDPLSVGTWRKNLPVPAKKFHFHDETPSEESNFFSNLYENYRARYEQMMKNAAEFHPMEDFRNMVNKNVPDLRPVAKDLRTFMAEAAQHAADAEESAMATATQMYQTVVPTGMDKHLTAMSHATYGQLVEAWNSVKNMSERLETARFLSKQRQKIRQQMKGYRVMLTRMREMSSGVPSKQMVSLMRRITECNEAMERLESRAQNAFVKATGFARKNLLMMASAGRKEPQRYAMYSSDPLMGIALYPLGFHLLVLGGTEIPLRIMLSRRGFRRCTVGPVAYYFHPGRNSSDNEHDDSETEKIPIVFVHGVGIGLIPYMRLIDDLLETGRAILLPEIPYVSSFRPWQSPNAVLPPAVVCSTMTAILATHGFLRATWVGHSYGTSWLSYMCKYASSSVAALLFLDPVCFCLHVPRLTKSFVYMKPDVGTVAYVVRTDVIVNWTIQRSFPWSWIILFLEEINVPCSVFLSDKDALVPAGAIEDYFRKRDVPIQDFESVKEDHFRKMTNCTVFRGDGHGDWTERPATVPKIIRAVTVLCEQAESRLGLQEEQKND